jgi:hypothetical protein
MFNHMRHFQSTLRETHCRNCILEYILYANTTDDDIDVNSYSMLRSSRIRRGVGELPNVQGGVFSANARKAMSRCGKVLLERCQRVLNRAEVEAC